MIDMRVGQDYRGDFGDIECKRLVVERFQGARALKESAIDKNGVLAVAKLHA